MPKQALFPPTPLPHRRVTADTSAPETHETAEHPRNTFHANRSGFDASNAPLELNRNLQPHRGGLCLRCWRYPLACHQEGLLPRGQGPLWAEWEGEECVGTHKNVEEEKCCLRGDHTGRSGLGSALPICVTLDTGLSSVSLIHKWN